MNILFVGQVVPHEICNNIKFSGAQKLNDTAGNNFYNHLLTGLANNGHHVDAMSRVTADISKEYGKEVSFDGVNYKFKHQKSNFLLNHISLFFSSFSLIKKWYKRNKKDGIVIVNCLRITQCLAAILAKKIYGIKIFSVVTDVPKHRVIDTNKNLVSKLADKLGSYMLSKYDKYVFLSEDMNPLINTDNKPYVVVEGLIDPGLFDGIQEEKYNKFTIMYAGALAEKYNIMSLVNAVLNTSADVKLIIYGSGELSDKLTELSKTNSKIDYRGQAPYSEILREETKVHLLVNPRSTTEEYTKLSFPSKNIEYMLSGTPCLFTKLKSMPKDYYENVFLIEDESSMGIQCKLEEIFAIPQSELDALGAKAKDFIKLNKNKNTQAKKIIG